MGFAPRCAGPPRLRRELRSPAKLAPLRLAPREGGHALPLSTSWPLSPTRPRRFAATPLGGDALFFVPQKQRPCRIPDGTPSEWGSREAAGAKRDCIPSLAGDLPCPPPTESGRDCVPLAWCPASVACRNGLRPPWPGAPNCTALAGGGLPPPHWRGAPRCTWRCI